MAWKPISLTEEKDTKDGTKDGTFALVVTWIEMNVTQPRSSTVAIFTPSPIRKNSFAAGTQEDAHYQAQRIRAMELELKLTQSKMEMLAIERQPSSGTAGQLVPSPSNQAMGGTHESPGGTIYQDPNNGEEGSRGNKRSKA